MGIFKKLLVVVGAMGLTIGSASAQVPGAGSPKLGSLEDEGFRGAVFLSPSLDRTVTPASGKQATPASDAVQQADHVEGQQPPPVKVDVFDPEATPRLEDFVFGPGTAPLSWRVWGGAEVLLGTGRPVKVVPVVTTGPAAAGLLSAGAIGQPGTEALFGGRKMLGDWRGGLRAEGGLWFDPAHTTGVAARFYSLYSTSEQLVGAGNGTNVVNVPQFVSIAGVVVQVPAYVGFPGLTTGTVSTTAQTMFAGGDLNVRHVLQQESRWRVSALAGYRQLYLSDELGAEFKVSGTIPPITAVIGGADNIRTRNSFYGPNVGLLASTVRGRWTLEGQAGLALGVSVSELDFNRNRILSVTGLPPAPFALTNVRDPMTYFGTVAEGGVRLAFRVTEHAKLTFGYTGLYWGNVRRAQEQLALSPGLTGTTTYYFAHMLSWGAEFRY
ncbi:MAG: hypothetical protein C0467_10870 [Planctomycetaceae bacterium]|nr:hypothetical protein [Planctomycetaceae bacterium]